MGELIDSDNVYGYSFLNSHLARHEKIFFVFEMKHPYIKIDELGYVRDKLLDFLSEVEDLEHMVPDIFRIIDVLIDDTSIIKYNELMSR